MQKGQNTDSFTFEIRSSHSFNYLVYIQNSFLNTTEADDSNQPRFPYLDILDWGLIEANQFYDVFKESWDNLLDYSHRNIGSIKGDPLLNQDYKIFRRLFQNNEVGLQGFDKSYKSFMAWWSSLIGQFALENILCNQNHNLYNELTNLILQDKGTLPNRRLVIELVYDNFPLGGIDSKDYYVVVPVHELFLKDKRNTLLHKIVKSMD